MSVRVGIVGSGFVAKGLVHILGLCEDLVASRVLTRSDIDTRTDFPVPRLLTNSVDALLRESDVVVVCSGDVLHATGVIDAALVSGLPVVTMDAQVHVTTGSYFVGRGIFTEAEGDQPGCLAAMKEDAVQMGFRPLVYGNIKGFLNHTPTLEEMEYWAQRQAISLNNVVAFTDGTKVQVEQALVANGVGATIAAEGLTGMKVATAAEAVDALAALSESVGAPVSDYILSPGSPPGVFLIATHDQYPEQRQYLANYKLGDGPYYLLLRNYHLCHLEVSKTIRRVMSGGGVLLDNSAVPRIGIAAIAKRSLKPGDAISQGIGSFDVRGIAVKIVDRPQHCPIGLLQDAVISRPVEAGEMLGMEDVALPRGLARDAWLSVRERVLSQDSA